MKIVQIVPALNIGGLQKVSIALSNALSVEHEVTLISLKNISNEGGLVSEISPRVNLVTLERSNKRIDIGLFIKVFKILNNIKPEVVHTHGISLLFALFAIVILPARYIHTIHNVAYQDGGRIRRKIQKILFKYFSVTPIALSRAVNDTVQEFYNIFDAPVIENSCCPLTKTERYDKVVIEVNGYKKNNPQTKVLINVGRISEQKNQLMLVRVFKRLVDEGNPLILIILGSDLSGDKTLLKQLEYEAKGYPVFLLGDKLNVADYMLSSDIFCLSSIFEGFPITLLEAMSIGLPAVCTPAGGVIDLISKPELGCLSDDISESAYYEALDNYLDVPPQTEAIKAHYNANYTIEIFKQKYLEVYTGKNT